MRISRLIKQLVDLKKLHGDLPVKHFGRIDAEPVDVMLANAYDAEGRMSQDPGFTGMSHVTLH
jgi:hypothetical protein